MNAAWQMEWPRAANVMHSHIVLFSDVWALIETFEFISSSAQRLLHTIIFYHNELKSVPSSTTIVPTVGLV
jgi:hypothetical protein